MIVNINNPPIVEVVLGKITVQEDSVSIASNIDTINFNNNLSVTTDGYGTATVNSLLLTPTFAVAATLSASTTNAEGVSSDFSRADHTHSILTGNVSTILPNQSNSAGSSANIARADHVHNLPVGTPLSIATTNSAGSASSFSRSDHTHEGVTSAFGRTGVVSAVTGDYSASQVTNTPAGNITSTNVQGAINQLDTNKVQNTRTITAGTGLTGGGDLTANRTISMPAVGTPGTVGSTTLIPVITTDTQGRVTSIGTATNFDPWVLVARGLEWVNDTGANLLASEVSNSEGAYLELRRARGTIASKTFLLSGNNVGTLGFMSWLGSDYNSSGTAEISTLATENHSGSATGGELCFATTPNGTTTPIARAYIRNSGSIDILNNKIVNLATPTVSTDAANKAYVDAQVASNVFGQGFEDFVDTVASVTTSATFSSASLFTTQVKNPGRYRIGVGWYSASNSITNSPTFRVLVDGSPFEASMTRELKDTTDLLIDNIFGYATFVGSSTHTISLEFSMEGGSSCTISRATAEIWRVS